MTKTFKKSLSIILVILLLLSAIPFSASAATRIGSVSILDLDTPVEGNCGDYGIYIPHNTYTVADIHDNEYENGIKWEDEFGNVMEPGVDRFRAGVSYKVTINLITIEPNIFQVVNATINGENVSSAGNTTAITLTKTFPAVEDIQSIHTLTFDYGFDGLIDYTFCNDGEVPDTPDYINNGQLLLFNWYTDEYFTEVFDINAPVYDDATVYARYVDPADVVTIYMYTDDPEFPFDIADAVIGDYVNVRDLTYAETGMFFTGWYEDPQLTNKYDCSMPIAGDVHLYARLISYDEVATVYTYMPDEYFYTDAYEVEKGTTTYIPDPSVDDMYFDGWYYDKEYTQPYNPESPITDDTSLFAKLIPYSEMHVVSIWLFPEDEYPVGSGYVKDGDTYDIEDPAQEGMAFDGWYTEPEFINKIEVPFTVTSDINIYAKFVVEHSVSLYVFSDSEPLITIGIADGKSYTPATPGMEGMIFDGWYTDPERINKYDTSTPVTEDIELYAKFVPECILGDVDSDGIITILDATAIQRHLAALTTLSQAQLEVADTDKDGNVSIIDATMIQRYLAKLITEF